MMSISGREGDPEKLEHVKMVKYRRRGGNSK